MPISFVDLTAVKAWDRLPCANVSTCLYEANMAGESAGERGILSIATQQELQTGASSLGTSEGTKGELKIAFNPL